MRRLTPVAGLLLALVPMAAFAAPTHKMAAAKKPAPKMYECVTCHMTYPAAEAKKDHFKDPMDGGKLVPVKAAKEMKPAPKMKPMGGMKM